MQTKIDSLVTGVSSQEKSSVEDNPDIGKNGQNLYPFLKMKRVSGRLLLERIDRKDYLIEMFKFSPQSGPADAQLFGGFGFVALIGF